MAEPISTIADRARVDGRIESIPSRTISYQPALDGVRALAVIAVVLFHADIGVLGGGYLGVSVFFTLSGYLITTLLATEIERDGRIALGAFYARRARRLLPASVLVVALVAVAAVVTDWFDAVDGLRSEIVGSLFQVANWVLLADDGSYQDLLQQAAGASSPLEHYWSLAIEEQFYWLWPVVFVGLWRLGRHRHGRLALLGSITAVSVIAAPVIAAVWGADAAYWATPARAAEVLIGAFLGLLLLGRRVPAVAAVLAPLALVALGIAIVVFPSAGGPAYAGALPAVGVVSALLLVGLQAESATRRRLSVRPLVWLGTISYGVYLFHWPIFVVLSEDRIGVGGPALLAMRLTTTLLVAQLSFTLFEQPIRRGVRMQPRTTLLAGGATTLVVALGAMVLVPGSAGNYWDADGDTAAAAAIVVDEAPLVAVGGASSADAAGLAAVGAAAAPKSEQNGGGSQPAPGDDATPDGADDASSDVASVDEPIDETLPDRASDAPDVADRDAEVSRESAAANDATVTPQPRAPVPLVEPSRPVRIVVAGDSTAAAIGAGLSQWAVEQPAFAQVETRSAPGCGLLRGGEFLVGDDWSRYEPGCEAYFHDALPDDVAALAADVVVLVTTSWDVLDRRWPDDGIVDAVGTDEVFDRVVDDFAALTDRLLAAGAGQVVWLEMPMPDAHWGGHRGVDVRDRHDALRAAMAWVAATAPDSVSVVDLADWFTAAGLDDDRDARPDGVHFAPDVSVQIADEALIDPILRAVLGLD
ncbi:MAG: acyltransferase family protein [Actinomycetota bacterium]